MFVIRLFSLSRGITTHDRFSYSKRMSSTISTDTGCYIWPLLKLPRRRTVKYIHAGKIQHKVLRPKVHYNLWKAEKTSLIWSFKWDRRQATSIMTRMYTYRWITTIGRRGPQALIHILTAASPRSPSSHQRRAVTLTPPEDASFTWPRSWRE